MANQQNIHEKSVHSYIFNDSDDIQLYTVKKQLVLLFLKNRSKHYRTQEDIKQALDSFGIKRTQGAISKGMKTLLHSPFEYHNKIFSICYTPNGYCLLPQEDHTKSLRYILNKNGILSKDIVFYEHGINLPQMFIFWINNDAEKKREALELFTRVLRGSYLDIFYIEHRLVVLLDFDSNRFFELSKNLKNFFSKENSKYLEVIENL